MENDDNTEKVLVLPLNEDSRKITQTLSNEKSLKILELLARQPMSATSIAEELDMPLTTIKYNLDGLLESELIEVKETKWSRKGREIKIYEPMQKMIVVVPGGNKTDRSSILGMLRKYVAMAGAALFAALGIEYLRDFEPLGQTTPPVSPAVMSEMPAGNTSNDTALFAGQAPANATTEAARTAGETAGAADTSSLISADLLSHIGVWFFFGCLFIITVLVLWEIYNRKKV
ncbi:ArsR/SmtB family transcription factor [Methanohalophilus sp.]